MAFMSNELIYKAKKANLSPECDSHPPAIVSVHTVRFEAGSAFFRDTSLPHFLLSLHERYYDTF